LFLAKTIHFAVTIGGACLFLMDYTDDVNIDHAKSLWTVPPFDSWNA
jgi:hypothetical protein